MTLLNRLAVTNLCNQLEELVGDQDFNYGYDGINKKVHFGILGGKYAQAQKDFGEVVRRYVLSKGKNKDELMAAVETYVKKMSE